MSRQVAECEDKLQTVFLTQVSGILGPIAFVLGKILNAIYNFLVLFGIENIALCIILFTFVVKMLMLPLTIKQQKFTKLSAKMSPELTKIQQKYKGKKDEESLRRQQAETQAVYAKYGASPMGGCLPLLISLPIMFALYRIIYAIPAYVTDIGNLYGTVADKVIGLADHTESITAFMEAKTLQVLHYSGLGCSPDKIEYASVLYSVDLEKDFLIDLFTKFNPDTWKEFFDFEKFVSIKDVAVSVEGFDKIKTMPDVVNTITSVNSLFGLSILDTPKWNDISVSIPILAVLTQFIQGKLQTAVNSNKKASDDPAQQTTKMMSTIMPIMSGLFCLMLPIGVGVYWIASAVFTIIQTLFINKYLDKINVDEMLEKSKEKNLKKQEKLGVSYDNKMAEVAKTKGLNYSNSSEEYDNTSYKKNSGKKAKKTPGADYQRSNVSYKASSISANANLLAGRNNHTVKKEEAPAKEPENTEEK